MNIATKPIDKLTIFSPDIRIWTTDSVEHHHRLDYWVGAVCSAFLGMDITAVQMKSFRGQIDLAPLGCLGVSHVLTSPQHVVRSKSRITHSDKDCFYLVRSDQDWAVEQGYGKHAVMRGELTLVDATQPYHFYFSKESICTSLELPSSWLRNWVAQPEQMIGQPISVRSSWGVALGTYIDQLTPQQVPYIAVPPQLLTDHLGMLLELVAHDQFQILVESVSDSNQTMLSIYNKACAYLKTHFSEHTLKVQQVADHIGTSTRSLHRAFSVRQKSFATHLALLRLQAAQRMLEDSHFDHLSISEIGYRVGYPEPTHFVRFMRKQLALTPTQIRSKRQTMHC